MIDLQGISQETFDDGIDYEVTSRPTYVQRYQRGARPGRTAA
jgi:hypothetical protein